jgi:hypothetical protein
MVVRHGMVRSDFGQKQELPLAATGMRANEKLRKIATHSVPDPYVPATTIR